MWSWFQTLRSCFGTSQKQSESPPPEPVNQTEGPLATSRRNELVPELPTAQSSRGDRLHWGQYVAPNTPGSQREEVLRPLASSGLRNRYATQPERHEIGVIRDLSESPAYLSARASDLSQPSAIELAILEREGLDTRQSPTSQCNYHLQPTNLESKLTAEGGVQPRTLHKSHDPKPRHHQHPPPHIVARTVRSGIPDQTILGCSQRSLSTPRSARLGRHNQPYHAVQASLTQRQPPDGRQKNIANGRSRVQTPRGSSPPKPVAEDRAQKGKLSRSASPLTLKRKSTNISASPSSALKGKRDGIGVSPQRVASARPHVPPLNLKQQDKSRASPRPRLTVDVTDTFEGQSHAVQRRPPNPVRNLTKGAAAPRSARHLNPPWNPPSPGKSGISKVSTVGKENDTQLSNQGWQTARSNVMENLPNNSHYSPHMQLAVPESPSSNPGSSPHRYHFVFSNDTALGSPSIVGVENQDEQCREDKHLRVHKTPFDIRVDRLIEREQAYKQQLALRRRVGSAENAF